MLYPSIQELLKVSTDENGNERLNKYTLVMATAKCARIITNESRLHREAERTAAADKRDHKKEPVKDEKAVRRAVRALNAGEFEVLFEGDEGYEDSVVDVRALDAELEEHLRLIEEQEKLEKRRVLDRDKYAPMTADETDTVELMDADEVYTESEGFEERYEDPTISTEE